MIGEDSSEENDWARYLFSEELAELLPHLELGESLGEDKGVTQLIAQHKHKGRSEMACCSLDTASWSMETSS